MKTGSAPSISILYIALLVSGVSAFGQPKTVPPPDFVKVAHQPDSPLTITINERYDFGGNYEPINYSIRNDSGKPVKAAIVIGFPKGSNHWMPLEPPLKPGATRRLMHDNLVHRKEGEELTLELDFVLFADGTKWGANKAGEAEFLLGVVDGRLKFYEDAKKLLDSKDETALKEFLTKEPYFEMKIPHDQWSKRQKGFIRGFGYGVSMLRRDYQLRGNLNGIASKIGDMERELGLEVQTPAFTRRIGRTFDENEPIKFVGVQFGTRQISLDENFTAVSDWLRGLSVKIRNDSGKAIAFLSLSLDFPETVESGNMIGGSMQFGQLPGFPPPMNRKAEKPMVPGQIAEIGLDEKHYASLMNLINSRQPFDGLSRVNLRISMIQYSDGTRWSTGRNMKQHPEDPKRWIPID